jgi:hypothetical protein
MTRWKMILIGGGLTALSGCIQPHGMQAIGGPDDAGYTYHYAQACVDGLCGSGLGSAALYGPKLPDGSQKIVPLGSASITSTGTYVGLVGGLIAAGAADGLTHNPALINQK